MSVDLFVIDDKVAYLPRRPESRQYVVRARNSIRHNKAARRLVVVITQDARKRRKPQTERRMDPAGPIPYPDFPVDAPREDGDFEPFKRD